MPVEPAIRDFIRAAIRLPVQADGSELVSLASAIVDWQDLVACAREHRIAPLLFERIVQQAVPVAAETNDELGKEYDRNLLRSLANATELVTVLKDFEQRGISAMPFKGVVLASSIYGSLNLRPAGDLDLLIFEQDIKRASAALRERGYQLTTRALEDGSPAFDNYHEFHFERPSDGMVLEIRWKLELQPRFRHDLGLGWLWPHRRTAKLGGVEVPDIDPERLLLILSMHGSKHVWSRLIWVCDIAKLLETRSSIDWRLVTAEARRVGLWRSVALGVILAQRICGIAIPEDVRREFESDRDARTLACEIEGLIFDQPGGVPRNRLPYNVRLLDFRDRARLLMSFGFLAPNARDREFIRLPKALHPLYYFIRPIRVLIDRSAR